LATFHQGTNVMKLCVRPTSDLSPPLWDTSDQFAMAASPPLSGRANEAREELLVPEHKTHGASRLSRNYLIAGNGVCLNIGKRLSGKSCRDQTSITFAEYTPWQRGFRLMPRLLGILGHACAIAGKSEKRATLDAPRRASNI
jgi:hypothetical protein